MTALLIMIWFSGADVSHSNSTQLLGIPHTVSQEACEKVQKELASAEHVKVYCEPVK